MKKRHTIVKKLNGGFHNGPRPDLHIPKEVTRSMMTIVKKMCDTPSPFHNGPNTEEIVQKAAECWPSPSPRTVERSSRAGVNPSSTDGVTVLQG
jgi:hypothetical protein